jgi:hypothetical protein
MFPIILGAEGGSLWVWITIMPKIRLPEDDAFSPVNMDEDGKALAESRLRRIFETGLPSMRKQQARTQFQAIVERVLAQVIGTRTPSSNNTLSSKVIARTPKGK